MEAEGRGLASRKASAATGYSSRCLRFKIKVHNLSNRKTLLKES